MREELRVTARCCGAHRVFYARFKGERALSKVVRGEQALLELFRSLTELASCCGGLRSLCVKLGNRVAAAAIYSVPERLPLRQAPVYLGLLRLFRWSAAAAALRHAGSLLAYARSMRRLERAGHLLFIASAAEGRGYGSLLLKLVERLCARAGCEWLALEVDVCNPAVRFYVKRGYRPHLSIECAGARYLLMVKPLFPASSGYPLRSLQSFEPQRGAG